MRKKRKRNFGSFFGKTKKNIEKLKGKRKKMKTNHVILGDCFEVLKDFPDNSVDLVFTSPPYNRKRNDKYEHFEDSIDDYCSYLLRSVKECMRVSKGWVIFNLQKTYYNKADIFAMI